MEKQTKEQHLATLRAGTEQVLRDTRRLTADLNEKQLVWRPSPDRWSIAHCYEHLILTGRAYYPLIEQAIDAAPLAAPSRPGLYQPTLFGKLFLASGGPRVRLPLKTHSLFDPAQDASADAPERFCRQQSELQDLLQRTAEVDLRIKVRAPHSRFLGLRLGETLALMVQHQKRHLLQARAVAEKAGFEVEQLELGSA